MRGVVVTTLLSLIGGWFFFAPSIYAASTDVQQKLIQTQNEMDKLFELQDQNALSSSAKQALEIDIKTKIILDVVDLARTQIQETREAVEKIIPSDKNEWTRVVEAIKTMLHDDDSYYESVENVLTDSHTVTLEDLKNIAKTMEQKKKSDINPDIKHIKTVVTSLNADSILSIADNRLQKVNSDVSKIYTNKLTKNTSLKESFAKAEKLIAQAHEKNTKAQKIITNLYADQNSTSTQLFMKDISREILSSLALPTTTSSTTTASSTVSTIQVRSYIETLTLATLDDIHQAYAIFLDMSANIKTYLQ